MAIDTLVIPDDWTAEAIDDDPDVISLQRPGQHGGFVTIDFGQRIFAGGYGRPHEMRAASTKSYTGRGWRTAIVQDAVQWLDLVMR